VNDGIGSGTYLPDSKVSVSARVPEGMVFETWSGDVEYLKNKDSVSTTVTMPKSDIEITAVFEEAPSGTYSISGTVSGDIIEGVTVSVDIVHSTVSDSDGNYTISGLYDKGTYTVTPALDGYSFSPESLQIEIDGSDVDETDFVSEKQSEEKVYSVSGEILDNEGSGLDDITVVLGSFTTVTGSEGKYLFENVLAGSYTLIASSTEYIFDPSSVLVRIEDEDVEVPKITGTFGISDNNPPVAVEDTYFAVEGVLLSISAVSGVLSNDKDEDGDKLTAEIVDRPAGDVDFKLKDDGSFTFKSSTTGKYTFTYIANDGKINSNVVSVTINTVDSDIVPPTAVDDQYELRQGLQYTVDAEKGVLSNDLNAENASVVLLDDVSHGVLELGDDGSFTYKPVDNITENDVFTYTVTKGEYTSEGTVTLIVKPEMITIGSKLTYDFSDKGFAKTPKLYGVFDTTGKKGAFKMEKASTLEACSGVWSKKFALYDKKAVKGGYKSYYDSNGPDAPAVISVMVKGKTAAKQKIDSEIQKVQLVPPVITDIQDGSGNSITEASAGDTIIIVGKYFGDKAPKVALEVAGKLAKCKVDKSGLSNSNYKGKPSAMDPKTGESSVKVILPASKKLPAGTYPIVLDNKVGIATTAVENGTLPEITIK
jgi:hypothetical protein